MSHFWPSVRAEVVLSLLIAALLPAASTEGQSIGGDVGPSFTESSAAVFAGALQMATVEPSSGVLRMSVPIEYPAARGVAQPQLGLYYSSASGIREAGMGWGLNLPSIERRGPAGGPPTYAGGPGDILSDFVFNGERLVPVCVAHPMADPCPIEAGPLPDWVGPGWIYFRLEEDTTLARFFWSPNRKTWRVQLRGGEILELGKAIEFPLVGEEPAIELDVRFGNVTGLTGTFALTDSYRWNLSRRFEPAPDGGPAHNVVVYRWRKLGETGRIYLTDVYHTPPIDTDRERAPLESFAHHVRLEWTRPFQIRNAYAPIWRATPDFHVTGIDVTSKPFGESGKLRRMVRRYHLKYEDQGHHSYLKGVQMEGRCATPTEEVAEALPPTSCPRLPATTLRYSAMGSNRLPHSIVAVPSLTLAPDAKSLNLMPLDLNGDSLPDFVETRPHATSAEEARVLSPLRRTLIDNGTWHVQDTIADTMSPGVEGALTGYGYTVTGDYTSRGETGVWWYLPPRGLPAATGRPPITHIPRLGPDGWEFVSANASIWGNPGGIFSGPGRTKLVGDINGDGLQDLLNFPDEEDSGRAQAPSEWNDQSFPKRPKDWEERAHIGTWIALRRPDGGLIYDPRDSCFGPAPADMDGGWPEGARSVHLADMNGDSLADFVVVGASTVRYWPSDGIGNFTACRGVGCTCSTPTQKAVANHMLPFDRGPDPSPERLLLADVNGDGYADFVSWSRAGLRVALNQDGLFFGDPIAIEGSLLGPAWAASVDEKSARVTVADMNGNGINDVVTSAGTEINSLDLHRFRSTFSVFAPDAYASRPGLLIEIDNGLGAQTQISYESTADMARTALITKAPWPEPMPQVMQVVQRLTTKTTVPGATPIRLFYKYDDPAWDGWDRRLRGFRRVTVFQGEPQIATESTYFIPSCPDRFCGSTAVDFQRLRAVSGRLLTVEVRDAQKRYQSTVSYSYGVRELAGKVDGRTVRSTTLTQVDTRLYDTTTWNPMNGTAEQQIRLESREGAGPIWSGRVPVRARESQLLRTSMENDEFGSRVGLVDHGRIQENGDPFDDPIVTAVTMLPPRPDWRFLPSRARTEPFAGRPGVPSDLPRRVFYEHDDVGRLSSVQAFLSGTLPLDRHHEDPAAAVAPPPPNASFDALVLLASYQYDDLGNIVRFEAPAGSCLFYDYDRAYGQWLVRERAALDGCTGPRMLSTVHDWDAGLETVLRTQQANGAVATQTYDAFGRLVAAHLPDPKKATREAEPSLTVRYLDQAGGPVQRVRTEQRTGSGASLVTWSYTDGFGRRLLLLRPADPAAGDGGAWIGSGLPALNTAGVAVGLYAPWFYSGDPAAHPLTAPATARSGIVLDSFGRPVEFRRPDHTLSGRRVYRPLQLESQDDAGRRTRVSTDGHGRLIEQRNGQGATESVISIDYLVGGEAARIVRGSRADSPILSVQPRGLVRWMQYDSLGRLVLNAEPNTAVGFHSDPAKAAGMQAWRYAYDWSGRLVGTSDARGCGWNRSYDRLGRMIATDLSPCLRSQAAYTAPNLADGTGTEVLYRYDGPEPGQGDDFGPDPQFLLGQLVSVQDRAAHTRFAYDARGRLVGLARRLAQPAGLDARWPGADDPAARYANGWIRSAARYDDADRLTSLTAGAAVPELLGSGGKGELTFGYSARGVITRIGGSYGALVTGATLDALGRPSSLQLGDVAATRLTATYAPGGRLLGFRAARTAPALWRQGAPGYVPPTPDDPPSTQTVLEDLRYHIDDAGLLAGIDDLRDPAAWPSGAKPVARALAVDDRARLTGVQYQYPDGADPSAPPRDEDSVPAGASPLRPMSQSFLFGGAGRVDLSTDDANALFDRSLGAIARGSRENGPDRLLKAANGDVSAEYDAAGDVVSLTVKRGICLESRGLCSHRFVYDWDEAGRLARARRWDFAEIDAGVPVFPALPSGAPAADLRYRYDAAGARVLRSALTASGDLVHSAWPLALLRLTNTAYDADAGDYVRSADTEEVAILGLARVIHRPGLPGPSPQHVLLSVADHLGSTSSVIDQATGELVERLTYLPYGDVESAYRPPRWAGVGARERFAGKEEDAAVGLVSFGARYYVPRLGQWLSADPLTIHGLGLPDPNPYAYVSGRVLQSADANGMQPCIGMEWQGACAGSGGGANGGFQVGFGAPDEASPGVGKGTTTHYYPSLPVGAAPRNSGVLASPATIPFWQALGRPDTWATSVDPAVIDGFNAGVTKNQVALVGTGVTAAAASLLLGGGIGAYELGAGAMSGAGGALRAFGNSVYVTTTRLSLWFNEVMLAQQGISIGGAAAGVGLGLSRVGRAQQIFAAALEDVPQLGRSTISVGDLVNKSGVSIRVISTNRGDMLAWLQRNLVLAEGEYLVPWVRGAAHAELNGAEFGLRNGFASGAFGTSIASCDGCVADVVLIYNFGKGAAFTLDNPAFNIVEILLSPQFFHP